MFGNDYPTPDGTCIRDYIHVTDLAHAHVLALDFINQERSSRIFNLGNEQGFSVKDVIDNAAKVTGRKINVEQAPRREGDPTALIAGSEQIRQELGWRPQFKGLKAIIDSAWKWHREHPLGFAD